MSTIREDDLVELLVIPKRRFVSENKSIREGQIIDDVWKKLERVSVKELSDKTGYAIKRILEHVEHRIGKRQAKVSFLSANKKSINLVTESSKGSPISVDLAEPPARISTTINRIIRDTELSRRVKVLHRYKCQFCGHTIRLPDGSFYAEAHHIQPLGKPHNGPDEIGNILCLCPNHHAELDYGVIPITLSEVRIISKHAIAARFVDYHNQKIHKAK